MEVLLYYPGCSIKRDFPEVERSSIALLTALGYRVIEISNWYCCGGFPGATAVDHVKYVSSFRTFAVAYPQARELGTSTIITLCPFCYNTLKQAEKLPTSKPEEYRRVADYLRDEFEPYRGGLRVAHIVEVLSARLNELAKLAEGRLRGVKVAAYYGCMLLRPKVVSVDSPESPQIIERIIEALGAVPVGHPYRTYCCGSFHVLAEPSIVRRNTERIAWSVASSGADVAVTPCPLCLYNLRRYTGLRVLHLSELIAYAINLREVVSPESIKAISAPRGEA